MWFVGSVNFTIFANNVCLLFSYGFHWRVRAGVFKTIIAGGGGGRFFCGRVAKTTATTTTIVPMVPDGHNGYDHGDSVLFYQEELFALRILLAWV